MLVKCAHGRKNVSSIAAAFRSDIETPEDEAEQESPVE
jgi:hypothetical protein